MSPKGLVEFVRFQWDSEKNVLWIMPATPGAQLGVRFNDFSVADMPFRIGIGEPVPVLPHREDAG